VTPSTVQRSVLTDVDGSDRGRHTPAVGVGGAAAGSHAGSAIPSARRRGSRNTTLLGSTLRVDRGEQGDARRAADLCGIPAAVSCTGAMFANTPEPPYTP
jgi:hypothetical protein